MHSTKLTKRKTLIIYAWAILLFKNEDTSPSNEVNFLKKIDRGLGDVKTCPSQVCYFNWVPLDQIGVFDPNLGVNSTHTKKKLVRECIECRVHSQCVTTDPKKHDTQHGEATIKD